MHGPHVNVELAFTFVVFATLLARKGGRGGGMNFIDMGGQFSFPWKAFTTKFTMEGKWSVIVGYVLL